MDIFDLTGEVAVVTGASKGLGRSFAMALAEAGADLFIMARNTHNLAHVTEEIRKTGRKCFYSEVDITDEASIDRAMQRVIKEFGKIDILVNNAAMNRVNVSPMCTTPEMFNELMQTNVTGSMMCSQYAARYMIEKRKGKIINIASISGLIVNKGVHGGSYEISKAATIMLSKTLATEWAQYNLNVNTICPGYYGTLPNQEFFKQDPDFYDTVIEMIPMHRLGEIKELMGALILLSSKASDYMQGSVIVVDGGYTLW